MPETRPQPDAEALVVAYLAAEADVIALAGANAVSTRLPRGWAPAPDSDPARLRVNRIGGVPDYADTPGHVGHPRLQISAFAADEGIAFALCAVALSRLSVISSSGFRWPGAVVNASKIAREPMLHPDPTTEIPGYLGEVILTLHPVAV